MAVNRQDYSASNKYETMVVAYQEALTNSWKPQFEKFCELSNDNVAAKRIYNDLGVGQIPTHNTTSITEAVHGAAHVSASITPTAYSKKLVYSEIEERRDPGLMMRGAEQLMAGALRTFEKTVFTELLNGGNGTTTVPTGASGAAINVFSDDHAYGTSGTSTQSNLGSAALSHTSLNAARIALRKWYSADGEPMELDAGPLALIVPPELGDTARRLTGSREFAQTTITSGAEINPQFDRQFTVVESAYLTDNNNWYLVATDHTPINLWIPTAPTIKIIQDVANRNWVVSVLFEMAVYYRPPVSGIYGSIVS